ncbi:MAG TPA: winged helix-turn-helix domain-containing protein [Gemmatimonadota bacterium]|nr:winged helix-turn-helix domain-containing protein [Gemmatimonadota bacterium]
MAPTSDVASAPVEFVAEPGRLAAALPAERLRLLAALREEPDSAAGLARRLGESRQRLNYHLRALEDAGVLEVAERRRKRGFVERVLRPAAGAFVVDPYVLGMPSGEPGGADRTSATHLLALAARTVREVAGLRGRAADETRRLATAAIEARVSLARPADFEAFVEEVGAAVADVVARHHDPEGRGRAFRVVLGAYQRPDGEEGGEGTGPRPAGEGP